MITQIYGLTCVEDVEVCIAAGADHVAVVPAEGAGSWDEVELRTALAILDATGDRATRVVLSLAHDADGAVTTCRRTDPDILHVAYASTWAPDQLGRLRRQLDGVPVMCTVPVGGPEAVEVAERCAPLVDYLLLDTVHPATGIVGATGLTHDWSVSARIRARVDTPVVLAGGLGPDNVAEAIAIVRPWGVDSETNTSRSDDRRRKDPDKVRRFIEAAHAASRRLTASS